MKELGKKYGVKVTDASERGIKGIGIVGGVTGKQRKSRVLNRMVRTGDESGRIEGARLRYRALAPAELARTATGMTA